jgi:hypothetical protein
LIENIPSTIWISVGAIAYGFLLCIHQTLRLSAVRDATIVGKDDGMEMYYEVTLSYEVEGEQERVEVRTLVTDFQVIEDLQFKAEVIGSNFFVEGYALKGVRNTEQVVELVTKLVR